MSRVKKDCTNCKYLIQCTNINKRQGYYCKDFHRFRSRKDDNPMQFLFDLESSNESDSRKELQVMPLSNGLGLQLDPSGSIINDGSFSIAKMVREAVNDTSIVPKDVRIDDGDIPKAKNFYDWMMNDNLCAGLTVPFLEQMMIGITLFSEYCPHCSDLEWMTIEGHSVGDSLQLMLTKVCLLEHGVCPICDRTRSKMLQGKELAFYREIAANCGQRSGKSAMVAMFSSYIIHRTLKMQKPNAVYSLPSNNVLHGTFVALTYAQAKDTLWEPLYGYLTESKFFQDYHSLLSNYGDKYGKELFKFNDTFIMYRPRSLLVYPAGPDKRVLRGKTRLFACLHPDSLIDTTTGLMRIRDICECKLPEVNFINRSAPVIHHQQTSYKKVFIVRLVTGIELKASEDHKLLICDKSGTQSKIKISDIQNYSNDLHVVLTLGDFSYTPNDVDDAEEMRRAYTLGQLCLATSIGDVQESPNLYLLTMPSTAINASIQANFRAQNLFIDEYTETSVIVEKRVINSFKAYGCNIGLFSSSYYVPDAVLRSSIIFRRGFIKGILISNSGTKYKEVYTYSKSLSQDIVSTAMTCGIILYLWYPQYIPKQHCHKSEPQQSKEFSYFGLDKLNQNALINDVSIVVDRTIKRLYSSIGDTIVSKVDTVVSSDEHVMMYDMEIDDAAHVYTANGIVVSNSIDELGWMDNSKGNTKVKMNAKEIYIALERSLLTVRAKASKLMLSGYDDVLTAYFMNVSSPSSQRDLICELVRSSKHSPSLYGVHRPTWVMNPDVSREILEEEFLKDPVAAQRDYGAEPPLTSNPFISSSAQLELCWSIGQTNAVLIEYHTAERSDKTKTLWASTTKIRPCSYTSIMTIDAGRVDNSFACSVGHVDKKYGLPVVDIVIEVIPRPDIPVNFSKVFSELLGPIIKARNVKVLVSDRWNSDKILDDAEQDYEIHTDKYSLKYSDMVDVKVRIDQTEIVLPKPTLYKSSGKGSVPRCKPVSDIIIYPADSYPLCFISKPVEHFILQCLTVVDTGKQVLKGDGDLTDDMWRAMCLLIRSLMYTGYDEFMNVEVKNTGPSRKGLIGVARLGSSGGGSSVSGGVGSDGTPLGTMKSLR